MNYKRLVQILDSSEFTVWDGDTSIGTFKDITEATQAAETYLAKRVKELDRGVGHFFVMNPPADVSAYDYANDPSIVASYMYYKKGATENKVIIKK